MTLEKNIVAAIRRRLKDRGILTIKLHGQARQKAGLPDLLALVDGLAVWLEVKRPGERPTKLQAHTLDQLRLSGCRAGVVTTVEEAEALVFGA